MPYFKWVGITLTGTIKRGRLVAYSVDDLTAQLLGCGVALLQSTKISTFLFMMPVSLLVKSQVSGRIAKLLNAGIMLPEALIISAQQSTHPALYDALFSCAIDIRNGVPFSVALEKQKKIYDAMSIAMLVAGYESGNLIRGFENVSRYYQMHHVVRQGVRSALAIPLLTLLFFCAITFFIFIVIMPRFADMFASLNHELPSVTRYMLAISSFVRSKNMIMLIGVLVGVVLVVRYFFASMMRGVSDWILYCIPYIRKLVCYHQLGQALNALALLVFSGVSLPVALHIVSSSFTDKYIKGYLVYIYDEMQSGQLLSDAMISSSIFLPEAIAVVRVGEESGTLADSLEYASLLYRDQLQNMLGMLIFFLQPLLIIVLGFLIMVLIFSVYLPIMDLSRIL